MEGKVDCLGPELLEELEGGGRGVDGVVGLEQDLLKVRQETGWHIVHWPVCDPSKVEAQHNYCGQCRTTGSVGGQRISQQVFGLSFRSHLFEGKEFWPEKTAKAAAGGEH